MRGKPLEFICKFSPDDKRIIEALKMILAIEDKHAAAETDDQAEADRRPPPYQGDAK